MALRRVRPRPPHRPRGLAGYGSTLYPPSTSAQEFPVEDGLLPPVERRGEAAPDLGGELRLQRLVRGRVRVRARVRVRVRVRMRARVRVRVGARRRRRPRVRTQAAAPAAPAAHAARRRRW